MGAYGAVKATSKQRVRGRFKVSPSARNSSYGETLVWEGEWSRLSCLRVWVWAERGRNCVYPPFCALVAVICSCDVHIKFLLRVIFILHAFSFANTGVILKHHSVFFHSLLTLGFRACLPRSVTLHQASSFLGTMAYGIHAHTHIWVPLPRQMRCPGGIGVAWSPPGVSAWHTQPPHPTLPACALPPPILALLFHHKAQVCVSCAVTDFFLVWGGQFVLRLQCLALLSWESPLTPTPFLLMHTHTRMHIPSCFRGRLRSLQTHTHKGAAPIPPRVSAAKSFNLTPGQSGPLNFVLVVKSTWYFRAELLLHLTPVLRAQGIQATLRKQRKEQSYISRSNKKTNQLPPKKQRIASCQANNRIIVSFAF